MESFKDTIRRSFSHKSFGKRMIGVVGLKAVQDFFQNKNIEGFIRYSTLYIKTSDQKIKIQAYQQKQQILELVNADLKKLGYSVMIKDIRF